MKNFIKAHPYLSCAGLAVTTNALTSCTYGAITGNNDFIDHSITGLIYITLPSLLVTAIDQYVNQRLFDDNDDDKPLQYGLTAVESVLSTLLITSAADSIKNEKTFLEGIKDTFNNLINPDFTEEDSISIKCVTAGALIQSLGFKYILDSANTDVVENISYKLYNTESNNLLQSGCSEAISDTYNVDQSTQLQLFGVSNSGYLDYSGDFGGNQ